MKSVAPCCLQMDVFVDRALAFLRGGAAEVRTAAAEAATALLRHCPDEAQRTRIYSELLQKCAADAFASNRIMFLEACVHAATYFSHRCVLVKSAATSLCITADWHCDIWQIVVT